MGNEALERKGVGGRKEDGTMTQKGSEVRAMCEWQGQGYKKKML